MSDNIAQRLKDILQSQLTFPVRTKHMHEGTPLYGNGLGLDSLDVVSLVVRLEEEFNILFEPQEIGASVETFGSLVLAVRQKLGPDGATGTVK